MPTFFAHALELTPCPIFSTILINILILNTQQKVNRHDPRFLRNSCWTSERGETKKKSMYISCYNCVYDFLYSVQNIEYKYTKPLQSTPLNLK